MWGAVSGVPEDSINYILAHGLFSVGYKWPQIFTVLGNVSWLTNIQSLCLFVCLLALFLGNSFSAWEYTSLKLSFRWNCEGSVTGMKVQAEGSKFTVD